MSGRVGAEALVKLRRCGMSSLGVATLQGWDITSTCPFFSPGSRAGERRKVASLFQAIARLCFGEDGTFTGR